MEKQTRLMSLVETSCNVGSGFLLSYLSWLWVIPVLFDMEAIADHGFGVTLYYTSLSLTRGYIWRRSFARRKERAEDAAQEEG